jgi:tetraacyldisaccharide 4'-kinase
VLDDGFQFYSLQRKLDIVLLDARCPFNNGHLMPAGRLREPPESLQRAGAIILTRCAMATAEEISATYASVKEFSRAPIFQSNHVPTGVRNENNGEIKLLETLKNRRIAALSALAHNEQFANSLEKCGAHVVAHEKRRDHHAWREKEVRSFAVRAKSLGAELLLTTEKDAVKIDASWSEPLPLYSLVIQLDFGDEAGDFTGLLKDL